MLTCSHKTGANEQGLEQFNRPKIVSSVLLVRTMGQCKELQALVEKAWSLETLML